LNIELWCLDLQVLFYIKGAMEGWEMTEPGKLMTENLIDNINIGTT
jgi:hypothetical protein